MRPKTSYPVHRTEKLLFAITPKSENVKTGDMEQLYIMPADEPPHEAIKAGRDTVTCGNCPLIGKAAGGTGECYVVTVQGPREVWEKTHNAPLIDIEPAKKPIRIGAYGEPVFAPFRLIQRLLANGRRWTGYTHQWREKGTPAKWSRYLMASVDDRLAERHRMTPKQLKADAVARGYRTFRIIRNTSELDADEIMCPNFTKGVQCKDCGLCDGSKGANDKRKNIAIIVHGQAARNY
jgi:hypothetical protein